MTGYAVVVGESGGATGLLVRRLQHDPELPGVGAVLLDECHERHLDTDLALGAGDRLPVGQVLAHLPVALLEVG